MNTFSTICAINSALILYSVLISSDSVISQELLSECDFVGRNALNCQWNNSVESEDKWTVSDLNSGDIVYDNLNVLILKTDVNQSRVSGSFESQFYHFKDNTPKSVCFIIRYIVSPNSSESELVIKATDRTGATVSANQCGTGGGSELWNVCQIWVRTQSPNDTDIKFIINGTIDSPNERFIAVTDISIKNGNCLTTDSMFLRSDNSNVTSEVRQSSDQIGPRITFWVVLMSVITILAIVVFIYIGISNIKKEHKKRLHRSKSSNTNNNTVEGLTEEEIFDDEFEILPRGSSFIMKIIRQVSSTIKSDNQATTTND